MFISAWIKRQRRARVLKKATDMAALESARERAEEARFNRGAPHVVEYFHQMNDPHSYLAAQCLLTLQKRYDIELQVHLVSAEPAAYERLPARFTGEDALLIAPFYDLQFAPVEGAPARDLTQQAMAIITSAHPSERVEALDAVCEMLWSSAASELDSMALKYGQATEQETREFVEQGDARRREIGAINSGAFYYEGEWYSHIDRLYHLENRLTGLGARRILGRKLVTPKPVLRADRLSDDTELSLEVFLTLDSPECAIALARLQRLVHDSGVRLRLKILRCTDHSGVSIENQADLHRLQDLTREAHALGVSRAAASKIPSPDQLEQALLLWYWAKSQGKEFAFLSAYYNAMFFDGESLASVGQWQALIAQLGLPTAVVGGVLKAGAEGAFDVEAKNREAVAQSGFGRFPLLRLLGVDGHVNIETVGHDRLWLVAQRMNHCNRFNDGGFDSYAL